MQIKFNNTLFELVDNINVDAMHFQATVYKGNNTVESIVSAVESAEVIKVYENETLIGQYEGYTKPIAYSLYTVDNEDVVSIELQNVDIMATVSAIQNTVNTHSEAIESIDAGIVDLAEEVDTLNETQLSQDAAIEDLAEGMAEMMEV